MPLLGAVSNFCPPSFYLTFTYYQGWLQQQVIAAEYPVVADDNSDDFGLLEEHVTLEPPDRPPLVVSTTPAPNNTNLNHQGRWWEKWIANNPNLSKHSAIDASISRKSGAEELELEQPGGGGGPSLEATRQQPPPTSAPVTAPMMGVHNVVHAPGRRLQGDDAIRVQIPLTVDTSVVTRQRVIARMAITKEWEIKVAHGIADKPTTPATPTVVNRKTVGSNSNALSSNSHVQPPLLDGRLFMSASGSYPHQVFSLLRYEPKKEEAARRRQKLEARGGGGTQFFIMPLRDWRGISYRALLPPRHLDTTKKDKKGNHPFVFDRFATTSSTNAATLVKKSLSFDNDTTKHGKKNKNFKFSSSAVVDGDKTNRSEDDDNDDADIDEDDEEDEEGADTYAVGLLDDPDMVQGRHRTVMIGDSATGCIVSSTIQFVKPELLKADLNKQFRERFDGWEPPKSQRKYIGARVVDGVYTLIDPSLAAENNETGTVITTTSGDESNQPTTATTASVSSSQTTPKNRQVSFASPSSSVDAGDGGTAADTTIRMPPSLTLSKIRSLKRQALLAAVKAKLEISTVALAIVYFERLCLDCRVDKSNRRLSFAACLLLAIKINEAHVGLVMSTKKAPSKSSSKGATSIVESFVRPTKKSSQMFSTILEFFIQDWNISLKHLFAAEWGVLASLQFRLHAKPSQVSFHFKRLMKTLDWNPRRYLGTEMYDYWQDALSTEEYQRQEREVRRGILKEKKEAKKMKRLQQELEAANRREDDESSNPVSGVAARSDAGSSVAMRENNHDKGASKAKNKQQDNATAVSSNNWTTTTMATDLGGKLFEFNLSAVNSPKKSNTTKTAKGLGGILNRFSGGKRSMSTDKLLMHEKDSSLANPKDDDDNASMPPAVSVSYVSSADQPRSNEVRDECIINIDRNAMNTESDVESSIPSGDDAIEV